MTFASIPVGRVFQRGASLWRKRSSRTAEIVFGVGRGLWFYWGQNETTDGLVHE